MNLGSGGRCFRCQTGCTCNHVRLSHFAVTKGVELWIWTIFKKKSRE